MIVDNLKAGTKLIWDAPEPFKGYAEKYSHMIKNDDGRIIYTCIVTNRKSNNSKLTCHLQTIGNKFHWLNGSVEYLRLPTEEELNILKFPIMKNYD